MRNCSLLKIIVPILFSILWGTAPFAQEATEIVTARGFGGTQAKALEQASYHAVIQVVKKNFASHKAFAAHEEEIRQYLQEHLAEFLGDPAEIKIISKYMRNNLTARIPVKAADVVAAVKGNFPDLEAP